MKKSIKIKHDKQYAPKYIVNCGGQNFFFATKKEAISSMKDWENEYKGSGIFPTLTLMEMLKRKEAWYVKY